ncbi:MAG: hypothetical protein FWB72_01960 [Firmicutes bacterium]|nr:hypothetical protein [Bacillota bacterium]
MIVSSSLKVPLSGKQVECQQLQTIVGGNCTEIANGMVRFFETAAAAGEIEGWIKIENVFRSRTNEITTHQTVVRPDTLSARKIETLTGMYANRNPAGELIIAFKYLDGARIWKYIRGNGFLRE